jgi:hypothetical protein
MPVKEYDSTLYYPAKMVALTGPPRQTHFTDRHGNKWPAKIKVKFEKGGSASFIIDPKSHYLAGIEASARLDISALSPSAGTLGLCFSRIGNWNCRPWAPFGVGCRLNPLVPGRDIANNKLPFGSRMVWGPPVKLSGHARSIMYVGDVFGSDKPVERVDIFVRPDDISWGKKRISADFTAPYSGFSRRPTKGAQQCLNALGFKGKNGKVLDEDDGWMWDGQTHFALNSWIGMNRKLFTFGVPGYVVPWDPEIYFLLRESAK